MTFNTDTLLANPNNATDTAQVYKEAKVLCALHTINDLYIYILRHIYNLLTFL